MARKVGCKDQDCPHGPDLGAEKENTQCRTEGFIQLPLASSLQGQVRFFAAPRGRSAKIDGREGRLQDQDIPLGFSETKT